MTLQFAAICRDTHRKKGNFVGRRRREKEGGRVDDSTESHDSQD
jgi:hypothetical protein